MSSKCSPFVLRHPSALLSSFQGCEQRVRSCVASLPAPPHASIRPSQWIMSQACSDKFAFTAPTAMGRLCYDIEPSPLWIPVWPRAPSRHQVDYKQKPDEKRTTCLGLDLQGRSCFGWQHVVVMRGPAHYTSSFSTSPLPYTVSSCFCFGIALVQTWNALDSRGGCQGPARMCKETDVLAM